MPQNIIYAEVGARLRAIRKSMGWTLGDMSKEVNMSSSYISEFERGTKLPSSKFVLLLHERYRVNVNYIYSEGHDMFMPGPVDEVEARDFGNQEAYVEEMLDIMADIPHALFFMLGHFQQYKMEHRKLVDEFYKERDERK